MQYISADVLSIISMNEDESYFLCFDLFGLSFFICFVLKGVEL